MARKQIATSLKSKKLLTILSFFLLSLNIVPLGINAQNQTQETPILWDRRTGNWYSGGNADHVARVRRAQQEGYLKGVGDNPVSAARVEEATKDYSYFAGTERTGLNPSTQVQLNPNSPNTEVFPKGPVLTKYPNGWKDASNPNDVPGYTDYKGDFTDGTHMNSDSTLPAFPGSNSDSVRNNSINDEPGHAQSEASARGHADAEGGAGEGSGQPGRSSQSSGSGSGPASLSGNHCGGLYGGDATAVCDYSYSSAGGGGGGGGGLLGSLGQNTALWGLATNLVDSASGGHLPVGSVAGTLGTFAGNNIDVQIPSTGDALNVVGNPNLSNPAFGRISNDFYNAATLPEGPARVVGAYAPVVGAESGPANVARGGGPAGVSGGSGPSGNGRLF